MNSLAYYFYMKTKILSDFQICISVPLKHFLENSQFRQKSKNDANKREHGVMLFASL